MKKARTASRRAGQRSQQPELPAEKGIPHLNQANPPCCQPESSTTRRAARLQPWIRAGKSKMKPRESTRKQDARQPASLVLPGIALVMSCMVLVMSSVWVSGGGKSQGSGSDRLRWGRCSLRAAPASQQLTNSKDHKVFHGPAIIAGCLEQFADLFRGQALSQ